MRGDVNEALGPESFFLNRLFSAGWILGPGLDGLDVLVIWDRNSDHAPIAVEAQHLGSRISGLFKSCKARGIA